jgi:hypothetical protein
MTTFSGYSSTGYYLTPKEDPFTITSAGRIFGNVADHYGDGVLAKQIAQITNQGEVLGGDSGTRFVTGGIGIAMDAGGSLNNSGFVEAGEDPLGFGGAGVYLGAAATVTNSGTIVGGYGNSNQAGAGIDFKHSGTLTNTVYGIIRGGSGGSGGDGVDLGQGGLIKDSGFIYGGNSSAEPGAIGVNLENGGTLHVYQSGAVEGGSGGTSMQGGAGVYLDGGTLITAGTVTGGAAGSGGSQGDSVDFGASASSMLVSSGAVFDGAIGGFHYGDSIDLTDESLSFIESHFNPLTDTVNAGADGTLQFAGDPTLIFSSDGHGGTLVTCACFRRGTRITAEHGERAVESLEIGDRVMTLSGELKRIRWIGKRHYTAETLAERPDMRPVLVRAGALDDFLPRRDLWVSPEHALYVKGALVPAVLLTNGVSILTDESVSSVSYYHLEFESHEVVFAEGAPAESFVDDDSRQMFDNAAEYVLRYPDAPRTSASFCAPRVEDGEPLQTLRMQLAARTGLAPQPSHEAAVATRAA